MVSLRPAHHLKTMTSPVRLWPLILVLLVPNARAQTLGSEETSDLLAQLAALRAGRTVTAQFTEKRILPMMTEPILESGTIAFEPPSKFLRRTSEGNLAVSDGATLWMYYPSFNQVEIYPLDNPRGPGPLFSLLTKLFQLRDVTENFHVTAEKTPDGHQLTLVPKSGSLKKMIGVIHMTIDENLRLIASTMRTAANDRTETSYASEKFLVPGSVDFKFNPPANANTVKPLGP